MSNAIFPLSIPGFSISMSRYLETKTKIQEAVSGKEWRTQWYTSPRYKYLVTFEFLRNAEAYRELNRVQDVFSRHGGALDSLLMQDPEDCLAVDQYLGSGDNTAPTPPTYFQLQRAMRAKVEGQRDGGESSGHPIINYSTASEQFSANTGVWTATNPWSPTLGMGVQDYAGVSPKNTNTAARIFNGNTAGRDVNLSHTVLQFLRVNQITPRASISWSIWVRALSMTGTREVGLQFGPGTGTNIYADAYVLEGNATAAADPVAGRAAWRFTLNDTNWTRIGISMNQSGGPAQLGDDAFSYSVFLGQPYSEILIWGSQVEAGTQHFSEYVTAMDAAGGLYGHYSAGLEYGIKEPPITVWPGLGSGSEPVHDLRPCASSEFGERWPGTWGAGQYQLPKIAGVASSYPPGAAALDWQGQRAPATSLCNLIRFSQDFSQSASWATGSAGTGSAPTFATMRATADSDLGHARGPDGSRDYGNTITFNVGAGTSSGDTSSITQTIDHPLLVQGQQYTFSVWLFPWNSPTNNVPPSLLEIRENTSGASVLASLDKRRSILDSRAALTFTAGASASITIRWRGDLAAITAATTIKVLTWGAQLEPGASAGWFLPTQAAAVLAAPEVRDNQPSIYKWDAGVHLFGTLLNPAPRKNLCNGSWSTGSGPCPETPTGYPTEGTTGGGSVSVGTSYASTVAAFDATVGYIFTADSMVCSSVYVRASSTSTATTFTLGMRIDGTSDTTSSTITFDPNAGLITRAGTRVVSAYAVPLSDRWFRLVMVSTWNAVASAESPMVAATGAACQTYLHIVEPGRSVGSPFPGTTWTGDYTILSGPSTNHPGALPGTVLLPGDLDFQPSATKPQLGQYYTWSGGYYRRVRMTDELQFDRIVDRIWSTGQVELMSVKP